MLKQAGQTAAVGEVIGYMLAADETPREAAADAKTPTVAVEKRRGQTAIGSVQPAEKPAAPATPAVHPPAAVPRDGTGPIVMPAAERVLAEKGIAADIVTGTGPGGRVLKEDALAGDSARCGRAMHQRPAPTSTSPGGSPGAKKLHRPPNRARDPARPAEKPAAIAEKAGFALPPANRGNREEEFVAIRCDSPPHYRAAGRGPAERRPAHHVQ